MIQVTDSSGKHYINPHYIVEIEGETIHTRIDLANGKCLEVRETPDEIIKLIAAWQSPIAIINKGERAYYEINGSLVKQGI